MKYIIIQQLSTSVPVMFPDFISHDTFKELSPTSAGFFKINKDGEVETFGESSTLHLKPDIDDAVLIEMVLKYRKDDDRPDWDNMDMDWLCPTK